MKKIMSMMLGLSLLMGVAVVSVNAQDDGKEKKEKKKGKKKEDKKEIR